ncbi:hypothetical protein HDV00_006607 [Rhizophlyctis rosea]|nr:hypothetical protein HDV00_006607 [Rhizophlyctis rosea]
MGVADDFSEVDKPTVHTPIVTTTTNTQILAFKTGNTTTRITPTTYTTILSSLLNPHLQNGTITTTTVTKTSPSLRLSALSPGALRLLQVPNAGGDSLASEVLSFDTFNTLFAATLYATEMEVRYFPMGGSILDYIMTVQNRTIGVSVTRAFTGGTLNRKYTLADATKLLYKKLVGAQSAMRNVFVPEGVEGCVLHVWVRDGRGASVVRKAWRRIGKDVRGGVVVVVSVCDVEGVFAKGSSVVWS